MTEPGSHTGAAATGVGAVVDLLGCPHRSHLDTQEGGRLHLEARTLICQAGHRFDLARQGYVNLLGRAAPASADTAAMVAARMRFLESGIYSPIRDLLAARCGHTVVDAGAGPGWYLAGALPEEGRGVAIDVSVAAAKRAARAHPRIGAVVADIWAGLPVASGMADTVLCTFAPRNVPEFARVLRPGGELVVVIPAPDHLAGAREVLGLLEVHQDKDQQLVASVADHFTAVEQTSWSTRERLDAGLLTDLVGMGPNAFHVDPAAVVARHAPDGAEVRFAVTVHRFRRRGG